LDDAANLIPSRISALLMIVASFFCRMNGKQAWRIFLRDRYKHKSPNSAQTEAVCAGALGVSLSGDSYYKGVLVQKPVIGDVRDGMAQSDCGGADKSCNTLCMSTRMAGTSMMKQAGPKRKYSISRQVLTRWGCQRRFLPRQSNL
jgi:adenosylcobinamide-phosphate synthase